MNQDYNISAGADLKIFPVKKEDRVLAKMLDTVLAPFQGVQSYAVFKMKKGGFFSRKVLTICILHNDSNSYPEANQALMVEMNNYFSAKRMIADCISLDVTDSEQKKLVDMLVPVLKFKKIERLQQSS